jgi:glycoprotein endo-alpha-1,2-mannosidase
MRHRALALLLASLLVAAACGGSSHGSSDAPLPTATAPDAGSYLGSTGDQSRLATTPREVQIFYYPWYKTPPFDHRWDHWTFGIEGTNQKRIAPDDPAITDWPQRGLYSSADPKIVAGDMQQIHALGVSVVVVSFWGPHSDTDQRMPLILDQAQRYGLRVTVMFEPAWKTLADLTAWQHYVIDRYGSHPAFYRNPSQHLPLIYVFDPLRVRNPVTWPVTAWHTFLGTAGHGGVRRTKYDSLFMGDAETPQQVLHVATLGFDGAFTYLANADLAKYPAMAQAAAATHIAFIPSVGPGFDALRIRPTDKASVRPRDSGRYYTTMADLAIAQHPHIITITSWNEWHEGTQIEPAIDHVTPKHRFVGYGAMGPDGYLTLTRQWVARFESGR